MPRIPLALVVLLHLAACDQWHLSINSDGLVFVSVIGAGAEPRGRFRIRTREAGGTTRTLEVPTSGEMTLTPLSAGDLEVTLLMPDGCEASGPNPQRLGVFGGQEARVSFEVRCG
ncbi:MAG: hypothetical protein ABI703_09295 [Gemmatimonadales bacterium]